MQCLHRWAKAIYQSPILIAVLPKRALSFLEYPKDGIGRIHEFELLGRWVVSEIDSSLLSIVMQRIGD